MLSYAFEMCSQEERHRRVFKQSVLRNKKLMSREFPGRSCNSPVSLIDAESRQRHCQRGTSCLRPQRGLPPWRTRLRDSPHHKLQHHHHFPLTSSSSGLTCPIHVVSFSIALYCLHLQKTFGLLRAYGSDHRMLRGLECLVLSRADLQTHISARSLLATSSLKS